MQRPRCGQKGLTGPERNSRSEVDGEGLHSLLVSQSEPLRLVDGELRFASTGLKARIPDSPHPRSSHHPRKSLPAWLGTRGSGPPAQGRCHPDHPWRATGRGWARVKLQTHHLGRSFHRCSGAKKRIESEIVSSHTSHEAQKIWIVLLLVAWIPGGTRSLEVAVSKTRSKKAPPRSESRLLEISSAGTPVPCSNSHLEKFT